MGSYETICGSDGLTLINLASILYTSFIQFLHQARNCLLCCFSALIFRANNQGVPVEDKPCTRLVLEAANFTSAAREREYFVLEHEYICALGTTGCIIGRSFTITSGIISSSLSSSVSLSSVLSLIVYVYEWIDEQYIYRPVVFLLYILD